MVDAKPKSWGAGFILVSLGIGAAFGVGRKATEGEPMVDYLHRVDAMFKSTICEPLWGLPEKQVLFVMKYMNKVWGQLVRILMQDMHLKFHIMILLVQ